MLFKSTYKLCAFWKMLGFQKFKKDLENSRTLCYHLYNSIILELLITGYCQKKKTVVVGFLLNFVCLLGVSHLIVFFLLGSKKTHKKEMFLVLFKTHYKTYTISKST